MWPRKLWHRMICEKGPRDDKKTRDRQKERTCCNRGANKAAGRCRSRQTQKFVQVCSLSLALSISFFFQCCREEAIIFSADMCWPCVLATLRPWQSQLHYHVDTLDCDPSDSGTTFQFSLLEKLQFIKNKTPPSYPQIKTSCPALLHLLRNYNFSKCYRKDFFANSTSVFVAAFGPVKTWHELTCELNKSQANQGRGRHFTESKYATIKIMLNLLRWSISRFLLLTGTSLRWAF